jgi:phosphoserine aminotransferase
VLVAMDATSGAGQIKIDFTHVDVYYFSPQKVFASEGGLYVAILSPKAIKRIEKIARDTTRYIPESMKLLHAVENGKQNQTYNTPSITTLFFLNEQLKLMNKLGEDLVIAQAKKKAQLLYGWAESKPYLSAYITDGKFRSDAVATIDVDAKYSVDELAKVLRAQNVAIDIEGYRKLGRNQFRIALFHNVSFDDLEKLTKIISLETQHSIFGRGFCFHEVKTTLWFYALVPLWDLEQSSLSRYK